MQVYAVFGAGGLPLGFYSDEIFPDLVVYGLPPDPTPDDPEPIAPETSRSRNPAIPAGAIAITDAQWHELLANPGHRRWDRATVVPFDPPPPAPMVPELISDRQFFQQLANDGDITEDEALAYVTVGTLPKRLADAIATLPIGQQFPVKMQLVGAKQFLRSNPLTAQLGAMFDKDAAALDRIWTFAAAL